MNGRLVPESVTTWNTPEEVDALVIPATVAKLPRLVPDTAVEKLSLFAILSFVFAVLASYVIVSECDFGLLLSGR